MMRYARGALSGVLYERRPESVRCGHGFCGNEWGLDETAEALIKAHEIQPLIIVGIYNTGMERVAEYTHIKDKRGRGGRARAYGKLDCERVETAD